MLQVNNSKFHVDADRDSDDVIIYPKNVYYPGQPAMYLTHVEAADLRDLLNAILNVPDRQQTKKARTGEIPVIERRDHE
jgi:hypothetical protein